MGTNGDTYWRRFGKKLAERDGMTCHYCGTVVVTRFIWRDDQMIRNGKGNGMEPLTPEQKRWLNEHTATVDHVIPRSHDGTDDLDNLVIACWPCNTGRGAARETWVKAKVSDG